MRKIERDESRDRSLLVRRAEGVDGRWKGEERI